jgi:flagellar biosynthetic protein FliO
MVLALLAQGEPAPLNGVVDAWQGLLALVIVLGLLGVLVWFARRGALGSLFRGRGGPIAVESVVPIGDRRALMIVAVEGRRLLLGASPVSVSLLMELGERPSFRDALDRAADALPERPR